MEPVNRYSPVGMFDSGVGGISVLRQAVKQLPHERFIFFGDTAHAPYGTKTKEAVLALAKQVVDMLLLEGCKAVVIACNTATSAAAAALRAEYQDLPIIGMEPALKPAQALRRDGVVLSLATPGTIAGEKYARLYSLYGEGVISLPCPGLMEFAERGEWTGDRLQAYLSALFAPYLNQRVEAVVLGCTHYVFLKKAIAAFFPGIPLIDGNEGTVRELKRRLAERQLLAPEDAPGGVRLLSSGGADAAALMENLLRLPDDQ
ncbi:MAG: glutamate racemase [Clostridiales bacterium]|nr:glutamate racemase [Clostridiales bacterium]